MRRHLTLSATIVISVALGVAAGTAFAGGSNPLNHAVKGAAQGGLVPRFSTTTALKVKGAAVINADATIARSSTLPFKVTSASSLGAGVYQVLFSGNVSACAYEATIGLSTNGGSIQGGQITTAGRAGNTKGVFVETTNAAGTPTNQPFHLIVVC
ncbi:MAG: hypothetical protein ACTHNU_03645 [Gaiellales bacterium]